MNYKIKIKKDKVYLGDWIVGSVYRNSITKKWFFAADVDYCSPLTSDEFRSIADQIDELNRGDR